jgi:hypothetical protein
MAFNGSDAIPISRAGTNYKVLGSDVLAYVKSNLGSSDYKVADIAARNALTGLSAGDSVMVDDATGDATVDLGWAIYQYLGASTWRKVAEQESLDIDVGGTTNLAYTAGPTQGIVTSDTGSDAILPSVDGTNAGLMLPVHKAKMDHISVSQAVDLDAVESASHAAVTTSGSASTNPISLTGQSLSFNIAGLASAP